MECAGRSISEMMILSLEITWPFPRNQLIIKTDINFQLGDLILSEEWSVVKAVVLSPRACLAD